MEGRMMTESAPEQNQVSEMEVRAAESAEQAELSKAQNAHLTRRVVVLRIQMDRFRAEAEAARLRVHELEAELAELRPEPEPDSELEPDSDPENSPEG